MDIHITDEEVKECLENIYKEKKDYIYKYEKPFVITFSGCPGAGKSYIAKLFQEKLNIPIIVNDEARYETERLGYSREGDDAKKVRELMPNVLYKLHSPFILDYNCQFSSSFLRQRTENYNYAGYYIIEINTGIKTILERITNRKNNLADKENFSKAGHDNYKLWCQKMKDRFDPFIYLDDADKAIKYYKITNDDGSDLLKQIKKITNEIKKDMLLNKEKINSNELYQIINDVVYNKNEQEFDNKN